MKLNITRTLLLALFVSFAVFLAGCDDRGANEGPGFDSSNPTDPNDPNDPGGPDFCEDPTQLFTIDFIRPAEGETNVSIGTDIIVNFSHEPEKQSIVRSLDAGLITLTPSGGQSDSVTLDYSLEGDTAFFTPVDPSPLSQNTTYTFTIKNVPQASAVQAEECANTGGDAKYLTITDDQGNPIDEKDVTFTTGTVNNLAVVNTVPVDGGNAGPGVEPFVTFNQQIETDVACSVSDPNAVAVLDNVSDGTEVPGDCTAGGHTLTFDPIEGLIVGNDYKLTVTAGGVQPTNQYAEPLTTDEFINFGVTNLLNPNCDAAVTSICVFDEDGPNLVDALLDGPLAPIADNLGGVDELKAVLTKLLQNDDGSLGSIVKGLIQDGQLQEAVQTLLLDEQNGLRTIAPELLKSVPDVLTDGVGGLLEALANGTDTSKCQSQVGTVCLVGGNGGTGLLDLLAGDGGFLNSAGLSQDKLVEILGQTLTSGDGSLQGLVEGLFQDGQLQKGLQAILLGAEGYPGLLQSLPNTLTEVGTGLVQTLGKLLGVDLSSLGGGGGTTPLSDLLGLLGIGAGGGGGGGPVADAIQGIIDGLTDLLTGGGLGGLTS